MRSNAEIIRFLTKLKESQHLSISEIARRTGMAKSAVSRYFNETREFPVNKVDAFAGALNTTSNEILGVVPEEDFNNLTIDELLAGFNTYKGKAVTQHDKEMLKGLMETYLDNRL